MKTSDIPLCPYFVDTGLTHEEDGIIQYDSIDDVIVMLAYRREDEELEELYVSSIYDGGGSYIVETTPGGPIIVLDDQEFTLHVYTHRVVL